jgi:pyruvate dehydrogenase E2 component (dihydrolipoamide acetyltransferase)
MALVEVKVPDIGDFEEIAVIELLVQPGDTIKQEQSLITVESDKASMEIPSTAAGVVKELKVRLGDKVSQGTTVALVEAAAGAAAASPSPQPSPRQGEGASQAPAASPPSPAPTGEGRGEGASTEVRVPDIGEFKDVAVIELLVKPGDTVKPEQSLITVESDKASMEIPSSAGGVVQELKVKVGDKLNVGDLVALLQGRGGAASPSPQPAPQRAERAAAAPVSSASPASAGEGRDEGVRHVAPTAALPPHEPTTPSGSLPHASPSVRKFARELGVPIEEVAGTGPKSRITQEDVQAFTKRVMAGEAQTKAAATRAPAGGAALGLLPWPQVDFAKFGPVERKPLSRIRKISGANLHRNWVMIPHVTNHDDADITELEAFRVQLNKESEKAGTAKLTMLAFLVKACVAALKKYPEFNSSLDGDELVFKRYYHIGFAADTPNGLMVPVIKDADAKGVVQIAQETAELAKKARDGKLGPADMSGATFTISSLGGIGGRYFQPIINAPEVAILGVSRSQMQPVWDGKQFQPRLMLPLSLSWDHRVIDGAGAARFNAWLGQILADFRRVML